MAILKIRAGDWVVVCDGAKALILENAGDGMVIPIYDNDPLDRNPYAFVTWTMIAISIVVFLIQLGASEDTEIAMLRDYALIPAAVFGKVELGGSWPPIVAAFTYMRPACRKRGAAATRFAVTSR